MTIEGRTRRYAAIEACGGTALDVSLDVCSDVGVEIYADGVREAAMDASPGDLTALAIGFLITEGRIGSYRDICSVSLSGTKAIIQTMGSRERLRSTPEFPCINVEDLYRGLLRMDELSAERKATCAMHCAVIFSPYGGVISFAEDADRHNALDKAIGKAAMDNTLVDGDFIICTGLLSRSMVAKAYRSGIMAMAGTSAPTDKSIAFAREHSMLLACFESLSRLNVYSEPELLTGVRADGSLEASGSYDTLTDRNFV
jgi:FdhD protein